MSIWTRLKGHHEIVTRFRTALSRGRLASSFLFVGPPGIGKRTFSQMLAQCLLCEQISDEAFDACDECPACLQVKSGNHPDVIGVARPKDRAFIPIELLVGEREKRNQEGLCHEISLKPFRGSRKVAIIDDADYLNEEGANCLLKTLEEPPQGSVMILLSTSAQRQLPTIRSRCQTLQFKPLTTDDAADLLLDLGIVEDKEAAQRLALISEGSLEQARIWSEESHQAFRLEFLAVLSATPFAFRDFCKDVETFVNDAGNEAAKKRLRLIEAAALAHAFFRRATLRLHEWDQETDPAMENALAAFLGNWEGELQVVVDCADRCLDVEWQVRGNATVAGLIESWGSDLSQLLAGLVTRPAV